MKKLLIITLLSLVVASCNDNKEAQKDSRVRHYQKVAYYYAESGLPWDVFYYDIIGNDTICVAEKMFHENGVLQLEGKIVDNKREGEFKGYYPSGKLMSVGNYVNGKREGKGTLYYENGQVNIENEYCNDKPCGAWKKYDYDGKFLTSGDPYYVINL